VGERHLTLARLPERRRMQWVRLVHTSGKALCVANLHASAHKPARAAQELEHAAAAALEWSGEDPLILGGDFNVRPEEQPWIFEKLGNLGFSGATGPKLIDHLLARGLSASVSPHQLPAESREVKAGGEGRVRLSDHAVVVASFGMG
jgi:endonuclease/exonuclease/phosphatase (EEP) superfamily protein YafD